MNSGTLKYELAAISYKDNTDMVLLRYLLMNVLALWAAEYRKAGAGTQYAFKLLQNHKKLENIHTNIKEKSRSNTAVKDDFVVAKTAALECMENFTAATQFVTAA